MDNYLLRHRLHKMFLLVSILGLLLVSNSVAAGYADEYRAKHPRRVKTTISQNTKGQYVASVYYKLFDHNIGGYRLKLDCQFDTKGPDLILLHCSTFGGRGVTYPPFRNYHMGTGKANMYFTSSSVFASLLIGTAMVHFKSLISNLQNCMTLLSSAPIMLSS